MEQIMKLPVDAGNVVLSEDYKSIFEYVCLRAKTVTFWCIKDTL